MGEVRTEYATMESPRPFARQLAQLSQSLGLPLPCSREEGCTPMDMERMHGRSLPSYSEMPPCQTPRTWSTPRHTATGDLESTWPYMKPCLASATMSDTYCPQIHPTVTMEGVMRMGTLWLPRATGTTCRPVGGT